MTPFVNVLWPTAAANAYTQQALDFDAVMIHNSETAGETWLDESGNGLHGVAANGPVWNAAGGPGSNVPGFWSFDGVDDHIDVGDEALLRRVGSFTLVWWMRRDANTQTDYARYLGKGNTGYHARQRIGLIERPDWRSADASTYEVGQDAWLEVDTWVMFAGVFVAGSQIRFDRVDLSTGEFYSINAVSTSEQGVEGVGERFFYGAEDRNDGTVEIRRWWRGDLAGAALFPTALSLAQLADLYGAAG